MNINDQPVECPKCGASDKTVKVSAVYIEALESFRTKGASPLLVQIIHDPSQLESSGILKTQALRTIVRNFGPPSGGRQIIRPVNPNIVVVAFTLIAIFFLAQIYLSQREMFIPILVVVLAFYIGYAIFRERIIGKFHKQIRTNIEIKSSYEAAVGRWMELFYCARDDVIFNPLDNHWLTLEGMEAYLLDQTPS